MKVYKATNKNMICTMGAGDFRYELGKTYTAEDCKCGKTGLHSCEYILDCMGYYAMGRGNRYFVAEASGDLHEVGGDDTRVASTELTLIKELDPLHICYEAMQYMIQHPGRRWEKSGPYLRAQTDAVTVEGRGWIGIARGFEPAFCAKEGAVIGLLHEEGEEIAMARVFYVDADHAGRPFRMTAGGDIVPAGGAE